jgi:hypothetical protein
MEMNEMGGVCTAYGGEDRCIQGFGEDLRKKVHLQDRSVGGRIIRIWLFKKWDGCTDWID